jgi:hypothetical protein
MLIKDAWDVLIITVVASSYLDVVSYSQYSHSNYRPLGYIYHLLFVKANCVSEVWDLPYFIVCYQIHFFFYFGSKHPSPKKWCLALFVVSIWPYLKIHSFKLAESMWEGIVSFYIEFSLDYMNTASSLLAPRLSSDLYMRSILHMQVWEESFWYMQLSIG